MNRYVIYLDLEENPNRVELDLLQQAVEEWAEDFAIKVLRCTIHPNPLDFSEEFVVQQER